MSEVSKEVKCELHRRVLENLKTRRKALKMTQTEIAGKLGMTPSGYSQVENGHFKPGLELIERIAVVLNTDPGQLFIQSGSPAGTF